MDLNGIDRELRINKLAGLMDLKAIKLKNNTRYRKTIYVIQERT